MVFLQGSLSEGASGMGWQEEIFPCFYRFPCRQGSVKYRGVSDPQAKREKTFRGIPVSTGVSRGKILVLKGLKPNIHRRDISELQVPEEMLRLERALTRTRQQLLEIQRQVSEGMGATEGGIFDAHLLVLEDRTLLDEITRKVQQEKVNVEFAFYEVAERYATTLAAIEDDYLRERATDMRDVTNRVLSNLLGLSTELDLRHLKEPCIIIGHDLTPSNTAQLDKRYVLGFAIDVGSQTSHTAIMARSLRIPAVVGLRDASEQLETGEYALLDGLNGVVVVNPTDQTLFEYGQLILKQVTLQEKLKDILLKPAVTLDNHRVFLSANIEKAEDATAVKENGAEGVGLFRTEYLFLNREHPPSEDQQYHAYREAAAAMKPLPVVIRTLDLGGDKFMAHRHMPAEMNPFLGWRAIRFCLQERDMFREHLRAILRASAEGNVKMMFPMISGLEELNQATALVEEYKAELRAENIAFDENLEIGAMIETPSAVIVAESLAKRLKFFSIGTNDLIQYSLAVDRMNEKIAHLYEPTHPAIVRLIKATVDAAHKHNVWVSVCGEMAGDPVLTPLLLGLGVDELSASPPLVPSVKFLVRRLKISEARDLAAFALESESAAEILGRCQELARQIAPSLFDTK
jgi:phosphotransferase system enzyme I (PtsI)